MTELQSRQEALEGIRQELPTETANSTQIPPTSVKNESKLDLKGLQDYIIALIYDLSKTKSYREIAYGLQACGVKHMAGSMVYAIKMRKWLPQKIERAKEIFDGLIKFTGSTKN